MRRLIIHIKDPSTDFLEPIYKDLKHTTVVRTWQYPQIMNALIDTHDQVIMLGHGGPVGLFADMNGLMISQANVEALQRKNNSVFIWCFAASFVRSMGLKGFSTSMFISEGGEARWTLHEKYKDEDEPAVHEQNDLFVRLVAENIEKPVHQLYADVHAQFNPDAVVSENKEVLNFNRNGLILEQ